MGNRLNYIRFYLFLSIIVSVVLAGAFTLLVFGRPYCQWEWLSGVGVNALLWLITLHFFHFFEIDMPYIWQFTAKILKAAMVVLVFRFVIRRFILSGSGSFLCGVTSSLMSTISILVFIFFGVAALNRLEKHVVIVGDGFSGRSVSRLLMKNKYLGTRIMGYFSDKVSRPMVICEGNEIAEEEGAEIGQVDWLGPERELLDFLNDNQVDMIIVSEDSHLYENRIEAFNSIRRMGIEIVFFDTLIEHLLCKYPVLHMTKSEVNQLVRDIEKRNSALTLYGFNIRIFNIFFSFFALLLASPVLLLSALIIKLESKGPVFFKQERVGRYGIEFMLLKFRTMREHDPGSFSRYSCKNDPRVTKFGCFLRKTRIDEIPQFINVLRGEMNVIGPRAEWIKLVSEYEKDIPYYGIRHLIRPGITGWAKVNYPYGRNAVDALYKLQYDLYYIDNRSVFLDMRIILKTIWTVLRGSGF